MKTKNILADTFLDEVIKFKGPLRRVPKNHFSTKLIEETEIDIMSELEKRLFTISMRRIDETKKLIKSVCKRKDGNKKLFKGESEKSVWRRKATNDEKEKMSFLLSDFECIQSTLMNLIKCRIPIYSDEFTIIYRPGYKIVIGRADAPDPINTRKASYIPEIEIGSENIN